MIEFVVLAVVLILAVCFAVWPVQLAAKAVRAERSGFGSCFFALIVATILQAIGSTFPLYGNLIALAISAATFAGILGTSFLGGIGVAVLHAVFAAVIGAIAAMFLGVGFLTTAAF